MYVCVCVLCCVRVYVRCVVRACVLVSLYYVVRKSMRILYLGCVGHKFEQRCGTGSERVSIFPLSSVFLSVCKQHHIQCLFLSIKVTCATLGIHSGLQSLSQKEDKSCSSPIFLQWIDCVFQVHTPKGDL